jgi:hypothetical protein
MACEEIDGVRIWYEEHGDPGGPALVAVHGGIVTFEGSFGDVLPWLQDGRWLIGVKLPGHGHTPDNGRPMSIDRLADDVAELLDRLGIERADLWGVSPGAVDGDGRRHPPSRAGRPPRARLALDSDTHRSTSARLVRATTTSRRERALCCCRPECAHNRGWVDDAFQRHIGTSPPLPPGGGYAPAFHRRASNRTDQRSREWPAKSRYPETGRLTYRIAAARANTSSVSEERHAHKPHPSTSPVDESWPRESRQPAAPVRKPRRRVRPRITPVPARLTRDSECGGRHSVRGELP